MATITPSTGKMEKGSKGLNCGDVVAKALDGLPVESVEAIASEMGIEASKYAHLNPGHRRMVIGSRIRKIIRQRDDMSKANDAVSNGEEYLTEVVAPYRKSHEAEAEAEARAA